SGRASRRFTEISSPHSSQTPKVPSSIFASALVILSRKLFSRPRSLKVNDWRYSLDARSISSGRSFASRVMSSSSVCFAFFTISSRLIGAALDADLDAAARLEGPNHRVELFGMGEGVLLFAGERIEERNPAFEEALE